MNRPILALLAAAAIGLTACGGGDPQGAATPTATATGAPSPEPTETQTDAVEQAEQQTQTYRVKQGDSLSEIAARFDTTVKELVRLNDIKDKHHIREGQKLKVPAGG